MRRLFLLLLLVVAAWYGWKHYPEILQRRGTHEAVVENSSGRGMTRVRLAVGGQTFVRESIDDGARAVFPFRVARDADFRLTWSHDGAEGEYSWSGGMVPRGPLLQRHVLTVDGEDAVLYRAENK